MVSPASTRPLPLTSTGGAGLLVEAISVAVRVVGVVVVSVAEVTAGPVGGVPVAVAVLLTEPAFTSAWVIVYVAVQVVDAPGASVVGRAGDRPDLGVGDADAGQRHVAGVGDQERVGDRVAGVVTVAVTSTIGPGLLVQADGRVRDHDGDRGVGGVGAADAVGDGGGVGQRADVRGLDDLRVGHRERLVDVQPSCAAAGVAGHSGRRIGAAAGEGGRHHRTHRRTAGDGAADERTAGPARRRDAGDGLGSGAGEGVGEGDDVALGHPVRTGVGHRDGPGDGVSRRRRGRRGGLGDLEVVAARHPLRAGPARWRRCPRRPAWDPRTRRCSRPPSTRHRARSARRSCCRRHRRRRRCSGARRR